MSNKAPQISLPQGGGAIRGLGESFQPDLHTGTGNFSVLLEIPAGRNGFQPTLTLSYSTGNPNGVFGIGWALSVPGVRRKTSRGLPRYDHSDVFVLSGSEDLVPVPGAAPGRQRYRPRIEGLYARIEHVTGAGQDYWDVASRDGLRSRYGTPRPADAAAGWRDPAAVSDPADPGRVFGWLLSQTMDTCGNLIRYRYDRDPAAAAEGFDQLYLADISYIDYGDPADPAFLVRIAFSYEARPDPFSDRRAGFETRTTRRCTRVETWMQHQAPAVLARVVNLDYATAGGNGRSLLRQLRIVGHDGDATQQLPPLEFGYTAFTPEQRRYQNVTAAGGELPATSLTRPDTELVDLFGNGLPCVLQMNAQVRYWRNLGQATLDRPRSMTPAPPVALAESGVQLADMNGDGRPDLLITQAPLTGYYPLTFTGAFDPSGFVPYPQAPTVNLEDSHVKLVDLTGDGVIDALRTASSYELYYNDPVGGWAEARLLSPGQRGIPDVDLADPTVRLADMTGDGLSDIVLIHDRNISYWPYLGYGKWDTPITMAASPHFDDSSVYGTTGYDPRRILVGDIDGDGCADVIYVGDGHLTVWLNQSGQTFADPVVIRGTPPVSDIDAVRLTDLHGTGTAGILWTYDAGTQRGGGYKFLDLTGGTKPYLLNAVDNHRGARTSVEYEPSTRYYLADQQTARPWRTTLPFPVQVVARITVTDVFSNTTLTSEYRYHHGYWDGAEREYCGFAHVDQFDALVGGSGQHWSPPAETRTWFHVGPVGPEHGEWSELDLSDEYWALDSARLGPTRLDIPDDLPRRARRDVVRALRGHRVRAELYACNADPSREDRPYTVTEHRYRLAAVLDGRAASEWFAAPVVVPQPIAERTSQWERGDDPKHRYTFTDAYDEYGRPKFVGDAGVPRCQDPAIGSADGLGGQYLMTLTVTDHATRDSAHIYMLDRVTATTHYEVLDDGTTPLAQQWATVLTGRAATRLLSHVVTLYDGDAFAGLPLGDLGDRGLPTRTEELMHTQESLAAIFAADADVPGQLPPYLTMPRAPWPSEYPADFASALPAGGGYIRRVGEPGYEDGWYAVTTRHLYSTRGLVLATRDALGHDTTIRYEGHELLAAEIVDPIGLATHADYDYRVLRPSQVVDPNGNRTAYTFSPLGLTLTEAVMGKPGEQLGDSQNVPGIRRIYDFLAFDDPLRRQPISVSTMRRVHHINEVGVALADRDQTVETVEFSDGFDRLLQTRSHAAAVTFGDFAFGDAGLPADQALNGDAVGLRLGTETQPRVVVTGWQAYDNKSRIVEKYEPFFALGLTYRSPDEERTESGHDVLGRKATLFYDPLGRVICTINPDGSMQRVIHGVPGSITEPDLSNVTTFEPTPWESYTYDANDNAGRTHPTASTGYQSHWNTPSSALVDTFGRTVKIIQRNGPDPLTDWYVTSSNFDIRGNLLNVTDPIGRVALHYVYDLAPKPHSVRFDSLDAGLHLTFRDAANNVVEQRNSSGALSLHSYDETNRPSRLWARDDASSPVTLREHLIYGDGGDPTQPAVERTASRISNLLGRLTRHYDEAGLLAFDGYDFKGNALAKVRQVVSDTAILSVFNPPPPNWKVQPFRVDWRHPTDGSPHANSGDPLDSIRYETTVRYDALNRPVSITYPRNVEGERKTAHLRYDLAGALESTDLDGITYVDHISHNAKGQRMLVVLGNGVMIRYAYDPTTFRLTRLRAEHYTKNGPITYRPRGAALQDYGYEYDLAGNLLALHDHTPGGGLPIQPDQLDRRFSYDPLYRLLSATGRECDIARPSSPWEDNPQCTDITRTRPYTDTYIYDQIGNMLRVRHTAGSGSFTKKFTLDRNEQGLLANRLSTVTQGVSTFHYAHDVDGNLIAENTSRHFEWDHSSRMTVYRTQSHGAEPSVHTHYLYDSANRRVKKLVRKQGGQIESTVYIDGVFEHSRLRRSTVTGENNTTHVVDNQQRISLVRTGTPFPGDSSPATTYHLRDHLNSSTAVLDSAGALVNREEYTPYGETSFGSYAKKRYRFTGKERDEESGLTYHEARYYAPWLCRWTTCDPLWSGADAPYSYAKCSPLRYVDFNGCEPVEHESHAGPQPPEAELNLKEGPYRASGGRSTGGHHAQASSAFLSPETGKDPFRSEVTTISVREGDFTQALHDECTRFYNRFIARTWGRETGTVKLGVINPRTQEPMVTISVPGREGISPPGPSPYREQAASFFGLRSAGVPSEQALGKTWRDVAERASLARDAGISPLPTRAPGINPASRLGSPQLVSRELHLSEVWGELPHEPSMHIPGQAFLVVGGLSLAAESNKVGHTERGRMAIDYMNGLSMVFVAATAAVINPGLGLLVLLGTMLPHD